MKRYLSAALIAGSAAYVLLYVAVALARMRYPYELEWMEGGMVEHVRRVVDGRPLYAKPTLEFVSFLYPPGYYAAAAAVSAVTGVGFFPLRLLSFLSSLGIFALLGWAARRETGSFTSGAIAAGVFAAAFARTGGWLDLARLDAFYLAVLLGGAVALRHARFRGGDVVAGILLAAAFFTKQSALVAIVPLLAWAALSERRRGLVIAVTTGVAIGTGILVLDALSDRWFSYYCFALPSRHPRVEGGAWWFWTRDLVPALPFALLAAVPAIAARARLEALRERGFVLVLAVGLIAGSWSVRSVYGAEVNNLLPACAAVALLAASSSTGVARDLLLAVQLGWLAYAPGPLIPSPADRAAGDGIVARLAQLPGEVFVPHHGYLARRAGKAPTAHTLAMDNVFLDDHGPARRDLEAEVKDALARRRFAAAVIESDGRYEPWIRAGYEPALRLVERGDAFWPVSGGRLRPETLALPRAP